MGNQEGMLAKDFGDEAKKIIQRKRQLPTEMMGSPEAEPGQTDVATFAAGCYWGLELAFQRVPGVLNTRAGFTGGHVDNPSYELVVTGVTGHAKAVQVEFDPNEVSFRDLLTVLWDRMDPTSLNCQGADRGTQYRSVIFYHSDEQRQISEVSKAMEQQRYPNPIVTEIVPASKFWDAEPYHQQYLERNGQSSAKGNITPIRIYGE